MSKSALALVLAVLCAPAAASADHRPPKADARHPVRVAQADDDDDDDDAPKHKPKAKPKDDDADADDDDADADDDKATDDEDEREARKAWRGKHPKRTDDDDDAATDDDDDDKPARTTKRKPHAKPADDDTDSDDAATDDDDDDDKPARTTKRKKRVKPADDDTDSDDAATDDDDDDKPARTTKRKKRVEPADDDTDSDDAATDDDDQPRKRPRKHHKRKPTSDAATTDDAASADATVDTGTNVVQEVYIIPPKVIVAGEVLGARPIDSLNGDLFGMGGGVAIGLEYYLGPVLAVHASASYLYLRSGDQMSTTSWTSAQVGPRLHVGEKVFGAATHNDAWLDAHVEYGSSGGIRRPGFDIGGALAWEVSPGLRMGPMVRWAFGSDPLSKNAQLITVGLAVGVGGRTRHTIHIEGDADGDGLIDRQDECPGEHAGEHPDGAKPGCPMRDQDEDGVLDDEDECPERAAGDEPDPERAGCPKPPPPDSDEDGVIDDEDKCPEEAGPPRPGEETSGCPLARVQDQKIEILEQIFFENDSATISDQSRPVLEAIGKVIGSLDDKHISIEGHTDEVGTDAYNMDLSKRRARAVAQWLIENAGIGATRLEVKGWGKRRPLVAGHGVDTSKNRRVEFLILESK